MRLPLAKVSSQPEEHTLTWQHLFILIHNGSMVGPAPARGSCNPVIKAFFPTSSVLQVGWVLAQIHTFKRLKSVLMVLPVTSGKMEEGSSKEEKKWRMQEYLGRLQLFVFLLSHQTLRWLHQNFSEQSFAHSLLDYPSTPEITTVAKSFSSW